MLKKVDGIQDFNKKKSRAGHNGLPEFGREIYMALI
jgi:hypothetical protein